jgi:hypothetical protein
MQARTAQGAPEAGGTAGGLTLRHARATGHAVWLQSPSQGIKARCNELIHDKFGTERPDETYLRGEADRKLWVEKVEVAAADGPDKDKAKGQAVTTIRAIDATIFDNGKGSDNSTVVARGPGTLDIRPARDRPVERQATWQDTLLMQPEDLVAQAEPGAARRDYRRITLTGRPKFIDLEKSTTLDARKTIVVRLRPAPKPAAPPPPATASASAAPAASSGSYELDLLVAYEDVHLTSPGKTMTARDVLTAVFEPTPPAPATASAPATTIVATPPAPAGEPVAAADAAATTEKPAEKPPAKPADPDVTVRANVVWAQILRRPGAKTADAGRGPGEDGSQEEVRQVRLRGGVVFHQDPGAGKSQGTDVVGEALDVTNLGEGKSLFQVRNIDPTGPESARPRAARLIALGAKEAAKPEDEAPPAVVTTDEFKVTGPVIGLDQSTDHAWVDGRGTLTRWSDPDLLTDKSLVEDEAKARDAKVAAKAKPKVPLTISWKTKMNFYGRPATPDVDQVGWAEFSTDVRAEMEDRLIVCRDMNVFLDRTVALVRPKSKGDAPKAEGGEAEPQAEVSLVECIGKVVAISRKVDPVRRITMQQHRITGDYLTYDRLSGDFHVPGAGMVYVWSRGDQERSGPALGATEPARPAVLRVSDPGRPAGPRAAPAVVRNGEADRAARPAASPKAAGKPIPPLTLIQVSFRKEMRGRFPAGKEHEAETRWSDFFGDVQALRSRVENLDTPLDFDRPPPGAAYLTAQTMRLVSEPTPAATGSGPGSGAARNFLKAWENAQALAGDKVIQGDLITYDSQSDLFYAYGLNGRNVYLAQQVGNGQPYSFAPMRAFRYNHATREQTPIEPYNYEIVDAKGGRAGPLPEPEPKPKKPFRGLLRLPGRSNSERKGYSGR